MKRLRFMLLPVVLAVLVSGCAGPKVTVYVNTYLSPQKPFPVPGADNTISIILTLDREEPGLEREVVWKLERLLAGRGYRCMPPKGARFVLECRLGMDTGQTRKGFETVHGYSDYPYPYYGYGRRGHYRHYYYPESVEYIPYEYTVYTKVMTLKLLEKTGSGESLLWNCTAESVSEDKDLRWVTNHLLLASFKYFGADTKKRRKKRISSKSKEFEELTAPIFSPLWPERNAF